MPLSEHVYCRALAFKMTQQVEQRMCIKFCIKWKLFRWFRRLLLWTNGDWQLHHNNESTHASCLMQVFGKTSNHPGDSAPLQSRVGPLRLLAFPKIKITFEKEEISDCWWDSGKYDGAADGNWADCVRSQGAYFEGDWRVIVLRKCFLYLVSSSIYVSVFHIIQWIPSEKTSYMQNKVTLVLWTVGMDNSFLWGLFCACRSFSSIPGLSPKMPVDPPPNSDNQKCLQMLVLPHVLWRAKLPPIENYQRRTTLFSEHLLEVMLNVTFIAP